MIELIIKYANQPYIIIVFVFVWHVIDHNKLMDVINRVNNIEKSCKIRHRFCLGFFKKNSGGNRNGS